MYTKAESSAIILFISGEKPSVSTGICDNVTVGYGTLDCNGYWEFPLPLEFWPSNISELLVKYNT